MRGKSGASVLLCAVLVAQAQEPPTLKFGVTTRLVEVNVIVRDKNGPVEGLTKDDFTLFDRKKEQKIAAFSVSSARKLTKPPQPLPAGVYTNRYEQRQETPTTATIVLLDALNTPILDQMYAKKQFIQFLKTLQPQDRVAVYLLGNRLRVLNDFTSDMSRLQKALEHYSGEVVHLTALSDPDPNVSVGGALGANSDPRDPANVLNDFDTVLAELAIVNRVETTAAALKAIAAHVARVPGRKNLIWITAGFPFSVGQYKSAEAQANWNDSTNDPLSTRRSAATSAKSRSSSGDGSSGGSDAYAIYGANTPYSDPARSGHRGFELEVQSATDAINSANIAIYPVDARGLLTVPKILTAQSSGIVKPGANSGPPPVNMRPIGIDAMKTAAESTGGKAYFNTNDLGGAVRAALDDAEVTYTLGFYADASALDSKFHELKVAVKRSGVDVRYRKGYIANPEPPPTDDQRSIDIEDAIWSPLDATGIDLAARIEKLQSGALSLKLSLDRDQILFSEEGQQRTGTIDIVFVQQSAAGDQVERIDQKVPLKLDREQYAALSQGFVLTRTLEPSPKAAQVRVVLYDRTSGRCGSITVPVK